MEDAFYFDEDDAAEDAAIDDEEDRIKTALYKRAYFAHLKAKDHSHHPWSSKSIRNRKAS